MFWYIDDVCAMMLSVVIVSVYGTENDNEMVKQRIITENVSGSD